MPKRAPTKPAADDVITYTVDDDREPGNVLPALARLLISLAESDQNSTANDRTT